MGFPEAGLDQHRRYGLDLVRAIAILLVLVCHSFYFFDWAVEASKLSRLFGWLGVDLFFVLSGFLVGGILIRDSETSFRFKDLLRFWVRRWFRTLPNYYLFLALNLAIVAAFAVLPQNEMEWTTWHFFFFVQGLLWRPVPFFNESWSLATEEWFYLFAAGIVFCGGRLGLSPKRKTLGAILVLIVAPCLLRYSLQGNMVWSKELNKITFFRLDSIAIGFLMAWIKRFAPSLWGCRKGVSALLGAAGLVLCVTAYFSISLNQPGTARVFLSTATGASIAFLLPFFYFLNRSAGMERGIVTSASVYSYSVYLINLPLYLLITRFLAPHYSGSYMLSGVAWLGWFAGTWYLSSACYRFFELPMTRLRDKWAREEVSVVLPAG